MATLYRIGNSKLPIIKISKLDDTLHRLGFTISEDGAYYYKVYAMSHGKINLGIICDNNTVYDVMAFAQVDDGHVGKSLKEAEQLYHRNVEALSSLSMVRTAAGFGMEGGSGGLHNVNLDESYGGPRWWSYESDEESLGQLENWLLSQSRYNPTYLSVGNPISYGEEEYEVLATLPEQISAARLNRDRQEVFLEYVDNNNQQKKIKIPSFKQTQEGSQNDGDMAQELDKYQLRLTRVGNDSVILLRKANNRGDTKGIWEINGRDSTPGFGYIDEDWKTSYSLHPEFLDQADWVDGKHSPGRNSWWPS